MKGNILGLLGICRKAGKLRLGFDPVAEGLGKDVRLLLFSNDISPKTKERMLQKASESPAASLTLPYSADELLAGLGKRVAVLAVTDRGLADRIKELHTTATEKREEDLTL